MSDPLQDFLRDTKAIQWEARCPVCRTVTCLAVLPLSGEAEADPSRPDNEICDCGEGILRYRRAEPDATSEAVQKTS